jgi:hypothetical protein
VSATEGRGVSRQPVIGVALVVAGAVLAVAPLGLRAWAGHDSDRPAGKAGALTAPELAAVRRERPALTVLTTALPLVPSAIADGAAAVHAPAMSRAQALRLLAGRSDLSALSGAVADPAALEAPLVGALGAADHPQRQVQLPPLWFLLVLLGAPGLIAVETGVLMLKGGLTGGHLRLARAAAATGGAVAIAAVLLPILPGGRSAWTLASVASRARQATPLMAGGPAVGSPRATELIETDLAVIQTVYGEIVPAVEDGALTGHVALDDAQAAQVIAADPRLESLQQLLTGLPALYGSGILATEASASSTPGPILRVASVLPVLALVPAAFVLLLVLADGFVAGDRGTGLRLVRGARAPDGAGS